MRWYKELRHRFDPTKDLGTTPQICITPAVNLYGASSSYREARFDYSRLADAYLIQEEYREACRKKGCSQYLSLKGARFTLQSWKAFRKQVRHTSSEMFFDPHTNTIAVVNPGAGTLSATQRGKNSFPCQVFVFTTFWSPLKRGAAEGSAVVSAIKDQAPVTQRSVTEPRPTRVKNHKVRFA
ncbi:hypothetical protein EMMF5_000949 [Cystobasidiomycetes sp. EMM_F5]